MQSFELYLNGYSCKNRVEGDEVVKVTVVCKRLAFTLQLSSLVVRKEL